MTESSVGGILYNQKNKCYCKVAKIKNGKCKIKTNTQKRDEKKSGKKRNRNECGIFLWVDEGNGEMND